MEVLAHNADYYFYSQTYEREVNMFSDMTDEEFEQQYGGCLVIPEEKLNGTQVSKGTDSLESIHQSYSCVHSNSQPVCPSPHHPRTVDRDF